MSTREGMRAIRGFLAKELQVYGLSISQARNIAKGGREGRTYGDPDANQGREGGGFQAGGWLGGRGQVGSDTIQVAPGYWQRLVSSSEGSAGTRSGHQPPPGADRESCADAWRAYARLASS